MALQCRLSLKDEPPSFRESLFCQMKIWTQGEHCWVLGDPPLRKIDPLKLQNEHNKDSGWESMLQSVLNLFGSNLNFPWGLSTVRTVATDLRQPRSKDGGGGGAGFRAARRSARRWFLDSWRRFTLDRMLAWQKHKGRLEPSSCGTIFCYSINCATLTLYNYSWHNN